MQSSSLLKLTASTSVLRGMSVSLVSAPRYRQLLACACFPLSLTHQPSRCCHQGGVVTVARGSSIDGKALDSDVVVWNPWVRVESQTHQQQTVVL